ncbi:MAG: carbohydrate binding family 9 domain-containing protein [Ignavibacteriae bacterium]|nr:carbohydrate binding family 9 domain-containing protein [Ignavibacteriota bacterium]
MRSSLLFVFLIFIFIAQMTAGNIPKAIYAARTSTPPKIDGDVSDELWKMVEPATGFTQRDPSEGQPATEATEIRVVYDDNALYFACMFFDSEPDKIVSRLTRRDNEIEYDRGSIRIDSYHDHQTAFEFTFNPAGVKIDILQYDDGNREDASWDVVWDLETKILPNGWSAEVKIPFHVLRYKTEEGDTSEQEWGVNFLRYISRKQEWTRWAFHPKSQSGFVSRFGHLKGLRNLPVPRHIELLPFVVARQSFQPATSFRNKSKKFLGDAGLDLRYGITSNVTLDLTINPDFGQVEADPAVLNLSTFETFYPEKRPFFIEGTQIIRFSTFGGAFGPGMFYSRRVGRAISPDDADLSGGKKIENMPSNVTILGAAKITGKTNSGLSVGIMQALTQEESATIVDSLGHTSEQVVEPFAHFGIVRMKQDVMENSNVGFIVTSVEKERRYPAFTGGLDWNLKFDNTTYQLDGFLSLTHTTDRSLDRVTGSAGRITYAKIGGEHWLWSVDLDYTSKKFNINDIGFFRRPNDWGSVATLTYKEDQPAEVVRSYNIGLFLHERRNFDEVNLIREANFRTELLFTNYWNVELGGGVDVGEYDDRETRGNGLYSKPTNHNVSIDISTDHRKDIIFGVEQRFGTNKNSATQYGTELRVLLKPVSWMEYEFEAEFNNTRGLNAWVDNIEPAGTVLSIFGERSTDEANLTFRSTVTFTRDLTLQLYTQYFNAKGHYENFRQLAGTSDFIPTSYNDNNDFNEQSWNSNLVFRWEYLPGSTLYLVWSQARSGESSNYFRSFRDDFNEAFRIPPANVVLLKVSYYLGL